MIQHVVTFTLAPMSETQEAALLDAFRRLPSEIPELKSLTMGRNVSERDQTYTHCLVSVLEDMAAVGRYLVHPAHVAALKHLEPVMQKRAIVDFAIS